MDLQQLVIDVIESLIYVVIGVAVFALSIKLIDMVTPFSIRKEIEEDQNVALGVIMGAIIIGLAIVIGAVLLSSSVAIPAPDGAPGTT